MSTLILVLDKCKQVSRVSSAMLFIRFITEKALSQMCMLPNTEHFRTKEKHPTAIDIILAEDKMIDTLQYVYLYRIVKKLEFCFKKIKVSKSINKLSIDVTNFFRKSRKINAFSFTK